MKGKKERSRTSGVSFLEGIVDLPSKGKSFVAGGDVPNPPGSNELVLRGENELCGRVLAFIQQLGIPLGGLLPQVGPRGEDGHDPLCPVVDVE